MRLQSLRRKSPSTVKSSATVKKTSAVNSTSSLLSKTLQNDQQMSTPEDRNTTTIRPVLHHTYKIQGQIKKDVHKKI